jgi:hypothetical protein
MGLSASIESCGSVKTTRTPDARTVRWKPTTNAGLGSRPAYGSNVATTSMPYAAAK